MDSVNPKYPVELKFDELLDPKRVWAGDAGSSEEGLGKLALLTKECVREAAQEILTGHRVGLNWDLKKLEFPGYGRITCSHKVVPLLDGEAFDDEYTFNPRKCIKLRPSFANNEQSRAASGTDFVTGVCHRPTTPVNANGTAAPLGPRYWTDRMTALAYITGREKGSPGELS